jgi:hypothetical protein
MKLKLSSILFLSLALAACTSLQQPITQDQNRSNTHDKETQTCSSFISATEASIKNANVIDVEARRIPGYPYLRTNRFFSDFRDERLNDQAFDAWVEHLLTLNMEGWRIELSNLPQIEKNELIKLADQFNYAQINNSETRLEGALQYCAELLIANKLNDSDEQEKLKLSATIPDEYRSWQRLFGLYPISALLFRTGIDRWHNKTRRTYELPLGNLPVSGRLVQYKPIESTQLTSSEVSQIISDSSINPLRIPQPKDEDTKILFAGFAPIFEIDVVSDDDRIGNVELDSDRQASINIHLPKAYQHFSYTRVAENILLQLNYTIWFPSRPKTSKFDLLGGHLDGITWRVTLLPNGKPWLYDTIHNCGCYHLVFPTQSATVLQQPQTINEPIFITQHILHPSINSHLRHRPVLRIAHRTHYIERVYFNAPEPSKIMNYKLSNNRELRSLKLPDGSFQSLFGQDGLIKSSQRNERFLFWPMGIPSPGAMRQWGHHATAFVGRRHFDDARLFENYFAINATDF